MLANLFWVLLVASVSAAAVIWVLSIRLAYGIASVTRAGGGSSAVSLIMAVAWPFAMRHVPGAPSDKATSLNKMLVALFAAILVAIASMAVYSNLTLVLPAQTHQ
ncbi:hypothetical protein MKI84_09125 [Ancylobacter sp. A5.8]|uniref:hypothetical protein n=1 Tax=Ancylobacter gelatini TaxID=2919920 RepID=UPI001F4E2D34|nr:hypothetical protein [Ancylobacter gelatini]MCJ8143079.1 hypothetical protein [Ancylobacter gelatini]